MDAAQAARLRSGRVIALVDGDSFYCSCERVFDPRLKRRPVIVLSNNDGFCNWASGVKPVLRYSRMKYASSRLGDAVALLFRE